MLDLSPLCIYILSEISKPPLCPLAKICDIQGDKTLLSCKAYEQTTVAICSKKQNIANFLTVLFLLITLPPTGYCSLKQNLRKKLIFLISQMFSKLIIFLSVLNLCKVMERKVVILLPFLRMVLLVWLIWQVCASGGSRRGGSTRPP